jgi:c-di-GMP-binding flagellar brake protein YcgR
MKTEKNEAKPRYGIANLERRKYRRFPIRLPIEYYRADSPINQTGQTLDASEGGLQILFPEQLEIGQNLNLKLFFSSGSELNTIEALAEVVWINTQLGEGEEHYRSGVRFINISAEDVTKLKDFSASLS